MFIKGHCYLQGVCEQADLLDFCASLIYYLFFQVKLFSTKKKSKISQGLISIKTKLLHVAQN